MKTDDSCNHCGSLRSLLSTPPVSDRTCRHCGTVWSVQGEPFTLCRGCREKLPVRKVNTAPLDRRFTLHLVLEAPLKWQAEWRAYQEWKKLNPKSSMTFGQFTHRNLSHA